MRKSLLSLALITGLFLPTGAIHAQDTNKVTATCKDGTAFTGAKRSGACRGHGGVQSWGAAVESSGPVTPAVEPALNPSSAKSALQGQSTGTVTATCKTARPSPARSGPAPAGAMAACNHGVRLRQRLFR
jgi:hypothetical protein